MKDHHPPERERGGRGHRVFAPGDLKVLLLDLLSAEPCHGYDLIRRIEAMFDGRYSPSPGVIYPTLTFLEESDLIASGSDGAKKRYHLTEVGRSYLADQHVALQAARERIDVSRHALRGHDRPQEIHEAVHNLRHALKMHHGRWTPEEIVRVRDLLNATARAVAGGPALEE